MCLNFKHSTLILVCACSDVRIKLANGSVPGHRFVLTARADNWLLSNQSWDNVQELGSIITEQHLIFFTLY
jgi:hypothetical protein